MDDRKVRTFIALAGNTLPESFTVDSEEDRKLGAQLLLSEVLEYVIRGLGVVPSINGVPIDQPNELTYEASGDEVDKKEMLDGLADVAYTMFWNSARFGIPLAEAYELVCDNNLEKFVLLSGWERGPGPLERSEWDCGAGVEWPERVVQVEVVEHAGGFYAVGKDASGKVRKPSHYSSVDLSPLLRE